MRAAKEAAKEAAAVEGKRDRKRKSHAPAGARARKARRSGAEVSKDEITVERIGVYCSGLQL